MLHKRKNIVLLLGKMLCYVVNLTPLSSHLLIQKTFPHAVKFDIFKESRTVSAFARNSLFHVPFLKGKRERAASTERPPGGPRAPPSSQPSDYCVSVCGVGLLARSAFPGVGAEDKQNYCCYCYEKVSLLCPKLAVVFIPLKALINTML